MKRFKNLAVIVAMLLCSITQAFAETITLNDWTSTNHEHSSTSSETYTFTVLSAAGELSFDWTVDCENADKLIVTLDGSQLMERGGTASGTYTKTMLRGEHVLVVQYRKDISVHTGSDQVSVSNITIKDIEPLNVDGLLYVETGANAATLVGVDELTEVVVPSFVTIDGIEYTVNAIASSAFVGCTGITSITIPNSVTTISSGAFTGCTGELVVNCNIPTKAFSNAQFSNVTIGESVTSIGSYGFQGCSNLTTITIPASVNYINQAAFDDCTGLKEVIFADGNNSLSLSYNKYNNEGLGEGLFFDCPLESLYLGRNLSYTNDYRYGYSPFYRKSLLTSVVIAEGVTLIGDDAFDGCSGLTTITLPESLASIGSSAFYGCGSLTEIHIASIESWLNIKYNSDSSHPSYQSKIVNLYINGEIVTEVEIPSTVTTLPNYAFKGCSSLTSITLSEGITSIGTQTFYNCSNLTALTIPASVTRIDFQAFCGCIGLKNLTFVSGAENLSLSYNGYEDGKGSLGLFYDSPLETLYLGRTLSYDSSSSYGYSPFYGKSTLTSLIIANGANSIGAYMFYGCSGLTSINISEDLTSIGSYAFYNCSSLTSINIPASVTSIGNNAFYNCSSLASVAIAEDSKLASIGYQTFQNCSSLTSINIPASVNSIGNNAFYNCSSLASVAIAEDSKLASIEYRTFQNCSSLSSMTIPSSVTSIGNHAFYGCIGLKELIFIDGTEILSLGNNGYENGKGYMGLFYDCPLESLYLGRNLSYNTESSSSYSPFYGKSTLTSLIIAHGVTSIEKYAFYGCSSLTSINIPESVASIGSYAFYGCSSLTSLIIPESVTSIGSCAFYNTTREIVLRSTNPATLTSSNMVSSYTVMSVPKVAYNDYVTATFWKDLASQITINNANARVKSVALTAEADKSALHMAIGDADLKYVTNLTISGSINSYDFMVMRNKMPLLRYLDLSETHIVGNDYEHYTGYHTDDNKFPGYGLYGCNLLSLTLPKSITTVGYYAMVGNTNLSEVTFFEGLTSIGECAFQNCDALTSVVLPSGLTTINSYAFRDCDNLVSVSLSEGIETIGYEAFQSCNKLTTINFPEGLTSIGSSAFDNCSALPSAILPPTVKTIGSYAFNSCSSLTEIRIPSSIRSLGDYAFYNCPKLTDVYAYTVEPINIGQNTFTKDGNNFIGILHAPKVSYWDYYYNTQWSQFLGFAEFDEPYDNFYLQGDKVLDDKTGAIEGEEGDAPDAEMGENSGIIVEDTVKQELGDVDINHDGENGGSIIVGGDGHVHAGKLHFHIKVKGGRWYFFCFPFDVKREDIKMKNGADWVFRYYDGEERASNGKGGWKNVTSDGNGNHLKAATGYIFQCSKDDELILTSKDKKLKHEHKYNELVEHVTQNMQDANWNFVGNPYLSYYEVTRDDYSAPITIWDGSKYIAIRPGDDDYQLAPFEAFFVQKSAGVDAITYNPDQQMTYHQATEAAAQARARRRATPIDPDRLLVNITLSDDASTDRTRVVFNNDAGMGYETECDAAKFSTAGVPQLYTIDSRAVKYAINERPVAEGIVTVGYTAPVQGNYTLAAPRMDVPVYLKDNRTGIIHDFSEGDYTFMTEAGTFEDRFTIIMKAGTTSIDKSQLIIDKEAPIYNTKGQQVDEPHGQGVYIKENRKVINL